MADATSAAKDRIDQALALLERRVRELKARSASASAVADDDLFAMPPPPSARPEDQRRIAELEAAGRDASEALARAAEVVRDMLARDAD